MSGMYGCGVCVAGVGKRVSCQVGCGIVARRCVVRVVSCWWYVWGRGVVLCVWCVCWQE